VGSPYITMLFLLTILLLVSASKQNEIPVKNNTNSRIIGGLPAHINQFPCIAAINVEAPGMTWFCGGCLYGNQWLITAAQCVDGATQFTIRLGSASLSGTDPNRVTLSTSTYFMHPEYSPETLEHDIALIKFHMPITLTDYVKPIDFLAMGDLGSGSDVCALGWGQTSDESSAVSETLQVAYLSSLSNDECKIYYGSQIKDGMACVGGNYNEGTCHGDIGSPLVLLHPRGTAEHVGIASFLSSNGCESTDPSGFTRTYFYKDWIRNTIDNNS
jgi:secreted trypsin-like serine protease